MVVYFGVGIYFIVRGIFALLGRPLFYTKRSLLHIDMENLQGYLKEIGILHVIVGGLFLLRILMDMALPGSALVTVLFFVLIIICSVKMAKCNEKYTIQ